MTAPPTFSGEPIKFIRIKEVFYSNKKKQSLSWLSICRGDRIRTCDPLLPKQMRYRTALRPVLNSDAKVIIEIEKTTV